MKTALIIGSTGLVGKQLLNQLLELSVYSKVISFSRRPLHIDNSKLTEHLVDFDKIEDWQNLITGDDLYSALGTTIKRAGSKEVQYKIDYTYQFKVAKYAHANGVKNYGLVSSSGANPKSTLFYPKIKGELEEATKELGFAKTIIVQPSVLDGNREEYRMGEKFGLRAIKTLNKLGILRKYRPALDHFVASCLIKAVNQENDGTKILTLNEVLEY